MSLTLLALTVAADPALLAQARWEPDAQQTVVELNVPEGWHLWTFEPGPGPLPLKVEAPGTGGPWYGPAPERVYDEGFKLELARWESHDVRLIRRWSGPKAPAEPVLVRGQICSADTCLNQRLEVMPKEAEGVTPAPDSVVWTPPSKAEGAQEETEVGSGATEDAAKVLAGEPTQLGDEGLFSFLALAFLFGLGALATPCVFPAIPLTVSFFSKYRAESVARSAQLAATYAATMVLAFTAAGVLASILFGVTGLQSFAASPSFNLFLAVLLVFFSLNLMGMFELQPPQWLLGGVNRLQGRVAQGPGGGWRDHLLVAAMALTATTVFFTCTVGFVGVVLVSAAQGEVLWPTLGMLAFSSAFALPFFVLALFPAAAGRLQGGSWLAATRVTLGFIELSAATKFLSNADLVWRWGWLTREVVLAFWIPLFAVAGLFLLGKISLGREQATEGGRVPVLQALAAVALFAFSTYLAAGMLQGRAFGGWLDGWLPPTRYPGQTVAWTSGPASEGPSWIEDLDEGRRRAEAENRLVFVNYTGYTCTNCRYMEEAVFPRSEIAELLDRMVRVELFTDGGERRHEEARLDQVKRFETAALPFYSVERADGEVIATFPSSTNKPEEFQRFLAGALRKAGVAP
ncbi:MAG: cytochrome c biogenesis protein CcdA [Myxococcota bacterium]